MSIRILAVLAVVVAAGCSCSGSNQPGPALAQSAGCAACHGAAGQGGLGPAWKGLYGSTVVLSDGSKVRADRAYIRRSILDPSAQRVKGYSVRMPTFHLSSHQVDALVDYIVSLR